MGKRAVGWYRAHLQPLQDAAAGQIITRERPLSEALAVGDTAEVEGTTERVRIVSIVDDVAVCEWLRRGRHGYEVNRERCDLSRLINVKKDAETSAPPSQAPSPRTAADRTDKIGPGSSRMIRTEYSASQLRRLAVRSTQANQRRRLSVLAAVLDGMSYAEAARFGQGVQQTVHNWVHRFNQYGPEALRDAPSKPRSRRLSPQQLSVLGEIIANGPDGSGQGTLRWRQVDLKRVIEKRFGVVYNERSVGAILRSLDMPAVRDTLLKAKNARNVKNDVPSSIPT